jgi:hypothetical protein
MTFSEHENKIITELEESFSNRVIHSSGGHSQHHGRRLILSGEACALASLPLLHGTLFLALASCTFAAIAISATSMLLKISWGHRKGVPVAWKHHLTSWLTSHSLEC